MRDAVRVSLVGAGPGDPGLLTCRGRECLQQAEVVVYDQLANPALLALAPASAERIYVGKQAGRQALAQDGINQLLVEHGRAGRRVVRLKGGDPFVFGRGGEEALALRQAGVAFEVVPGVTAGVAAPAYAGIPVTQRGLSSVVSLVTGHEDPTKAVSGLHWEALARTGGTLVFYMGVGNLAAIAGRLIAAGRPAVTPVAVVSRGTLPTQQVVEGTLDTIAARVTAAGLQAPAVTVVGEVAHLRQELQWFETAPLFGRTVVVTRAQAQAGDLAARLERQGADVLRLPTIAIAPVADPGPLQAAVADLGRFDWLVLGSAHAVEAVFAALDQVGRDTRALAGCRVAAVGSATAAALRQRGVIADLVPASFTSTALAKALAQTGNLAGGRILLPQADIAPAELADSLRAAGAEVESLVAYHTVPVPPAAAVLEAFRRGTVDAVTFTSSSTVRHYAAALQAALGQVPPDLVYVSIGPETTRTARALGLTIAAEAAEATLDGLTAALVALAEKGTL